MKALVSYIKNNQVISVSIGIAVALIMTFVVYPEYQNYRMKKQMAEFFSMAETLQTNRLNQIK